MSCHCGGSCGSCQPPSRFRPAAYPVTFPSRQQASEANPAKGPSPKNGNHAVATTAVVVENTREGVGDSSHNQVWTPGKTPTWGSVSPIRWRHLIATMASARVQVLDTLYTRGDLTPKWDIDTRRGRPSHPALREPTYNYNGVTDDQVISLAKQRAIAREKQAATLAKYGKR